MKIAIVDDNAEFAKQFSLMFYSYPFDEYKLEITLITEDFSNIACTLDVYFIDVDLIECSGFDLSSKIRESNPTAIIVFVTATADYVFESFNYSPFGFLRKEFLHDDFDRTLNRVLLKYKQQNSYYDFEYGGLIAKIYIKDIIYIEKNKNKVNIVTKKQNFSERKSISKIFASLDSSFGKINRSQIINFDHVDKITQQYFLMSNGKRFFFRNKYRKETMKMYYNYLIKKNRC